MFSSLPSAKRPNGRTATGVEEFRWLLVSPGSPPLTFVNMKERHSKKFFPLPTHSPSLSAQYPHEGELHNVRVEEKELSPLIPLRPAVTGLHRTSTVGGALREENILQ